MNKLYTKILYKRDRTIHKRKRVGRYPQQMPTMFFKPKKVSFPVIIMPRRNQPKSQIYINDSNLLDEEGWLFLNLP